jgi:D-beta-D-heptose 7-phosphate kinase/D-beta-D-heptose 1-phosphate adenosyltransferase
MGLAGDDAAGGRLLDLLRAESIDTGGVQRYSGWSTIVKTRIIARHQQVVRVDRERKANPGAGPAERAARDLERMIDSLDGIIVADYAKGFVTQPLADAICRIAREYGKILTVDPHPHTGLAWNGVTAIKPNRAEAFLAAGLPPSDPVLPVLEDEALLEAGRRLLDHWRTGSLLITLGEHGMLLFEAGQPPYHTPTRAREVFDVSGAGDTAIAVFTLALCAGGTPAEAAELANRASAVAVGKLGTATVTTAELEASLSA